MPYYALCDPFPGNICQQVSPTRRMCLVALIAMSTSWWPVCVAFRCLTCLLKPFRSVPFCTKAKYSCVPIPSAAKASRSLSGIIKGLV